MPEAVKRQKNFTEKYSASTPPRVEYRRLNDNLTAESSTTFRESRGKLMTNLLENKPEEITMSHALLSEFVVVLALDPLVRQRGYRVDLAPQTLEHGNKQKGVDVLVVGRSEKIMMGIDVKLRKKTPDRGRNGGGWQDNISAPAINLNLGNWDVETKDESVDGVKVWLTRGVLPNVVEGGKIPGMNSLRAYLVPRIRRSLENQLERMENKLPNCRTDSRMDRQSQVACKQKLRGLIELFTNAEESLTHK